ncbi:MAG: flavodoxin-dependent (E)-4-hydroxy-3-methylbut-2-enyl-diphosphate synthase [Candidatus Wallbacteria bacterium]|nr:flavodoxin-dependent (E)-4-hydroxy-3-methylbut-2-enyl-diphosphate synthase [Candidatus Wallbacteria bacterium]
MSLVPISIADLRGATAEPLDDLRAAKMRGAGLFLVHSRQLSATSERGALEGDFLLEWDETLDTATLDPSLWRFLVAPGQFPAFARWALNRLGNIEALLQLAPEEESDLACCVLPHLEAIPGVRPVLAPVASDAPQLLAAARRLLTRTPYPLSLLPLTGSYDPDAMTLVFSSLMESGRVHSFLVPSPDPRHSAAAATSLLNALELRRFGVNYVSCPTCGRCEIPLEEIVAQVRQQTSDISTPLNVAIMGCVVNGPGESKHADIGIAGGRSGGVLIKNGQVVGKLEKHEFVDALVREIRQMARDRGETISG